MYEAPGGQDGSESSPGFDVQVRCPACGAEFRVSRIRRGGEEPCPVCRCRVRVPGEGARDDSAQAPQPKASPDDTVAAAAIVGQERYAEEEPEAGPAGPPEGNCVVCARDDGRFNPMDVSPVVAEMTGRFDTDVKMQVTKGRGVLAECVAGPVAVELARRLEAAGVPVVVVPEDAVPRVDSELPLIRVHGALGDGLHVQSDVRGTVKAIPWDAMRACFCTRQHSVRGGPTQLDRADSEFIAFSMQSGAARSSMRFRAAPRPPQARTECTLLVEGRSGRCFSARFTEQEVRYAYLGPRQRPSSALNFRLFLSDLMRYCPRAFFPSSTREVAAGRGMRAARVRDKVDYERYLKWVLCRTAARTP